MFLDGNSMYGEGFVQYLHMGSSRRILLLFTVFCPLGGNVLFVSMEEALCFFFIFLNQIFECHNVGLSLD